MSEHSPEPWSVGDAYGCACLFAETGQDPIGIDLSESDARRIVACVNFCRGLETEYLEKSPPPGRAITFLDRFRDGVAIVTEGPCWTPDGQLAWIEPFSSTAIAVVKSEEGDPRDWPSWLATECFSTEAAYEEASHGAAQP